MKDEIAVDGVVYVPKSSVRMAGCRVPYCIVRTYSAGVFAGYLTERKGQEGKVLDARRLWYWSGAASLSQLAVDGVKNPDKCKFPCEISEVLLTNIIEVIPCTEKAKISIAEVKIWEQ